MSTFQCERCSFIAKSQSGLTTHKKSHLADDYENLKVDHEKMVIMYDAFKDLHISKETSESTVILGLAYKYNVLNDKYQELIQKKKDIIYSLSECEDTFLKKRYNVVMKFSTEDYILKSTTTTADKDLLSFKGDLYLIPMIIVYDNGTYKIRFEYEKMPQVSQSEGQCFNIGFYVIPKTQLILRGFKDYLHIFTSYYINNRPFFAPFIDEVNTYTVNTFNSLIALYHTGVLFRVLQTEY